MEKIRDDSKKLNGRKIGNYEEASSGDKSKVVVDRHVARMLFGVTSPTKAQFEKAEKVLTEIANLIGWEPREVQAAIWAASIRKSGNEPESYDQYLKRLKREGSLERRIGFPLPTSGGDSTQRADRGSDSGSSNVSGDRSGLEAGEPLTEAESRDEVGFSVVKMSANRLADQKGIPSKIPDDAKGRKFVPIMADRMAGEGTLYGVDLQGGPIYPLMNHDKSNPDKITGVWASRLGGVKLILATVKKMGAIFERDGKRYALVAPFAMGPDAHRSNQTFQEAIVARFEEMVSAGMISAAQEKAIAKIIKARAESNALGTDRLRNFPEKFTSKEFKSYMESLSFDERAFISQTLASAEAEKAGAPSAKLLLEQARDTSLFGVETGSLISLLEIDIDALEQALSENDATAERFGVKPHRSYETVIPGRVVTHFRQPIPIEVGAKSLVDDLKVASPNSRVDYLLQGRIPKGITAPSLDQVTIDNINDVQDIPIPRADAVAMAAAMMDEWITLDTKSQKGAKDYVRAIEASEASATLTVYDAKEISKWMRDGYMRVFKLGENDIYFGLLEGEYDAESRTVIDNGEITLVGVVNNTPIKGVLNMIMAKALQEGANKLDCFAVANDAKPDGLLPTLYGRFGWEVDESFDYDPLYRDDGDTSTDAELKKKHQARTQVWKTQGWNESRQGLPPVVFMSHEGVGSKATTDRDSVEGMAQGPIGEIRANAVEPFGGDVRDGEEQSFASRSGGATGGGRRILPRGNDTLVETLRAADSNRLRVLGISEEQRQKVLQAKELGVSFSVLENAEERIADMFSPFQRSPVLRHEVGARAHKKVIDLLQQFRPVFEANRTPQEINEEARRVEEEKLAELLDGTSPATVGALEFSESIDDVAQRPILAELTTYRTITRKDGKVVRIPTGSLMGKTRAKKEGRSTAEYDDMPEGLPSYVFGGNLSPDQAAQQTGFDDVAEFFSALEAEVNSFKSAKSAAAAARREVAGFSREAREAGRARKAELLKEKKIVGSDKKTLLGALRMLDAVVSSLPMEIRGKIGGVTTIAQMSSPRVMLNEIERRVKRADQELEYFLYKEADVALDELLKRIDRTKDTRAGKKAKSRLDQSFHTLVDAAKTARNLLTSEQGEMEAEKQEVVIRNIEEIDVDALSDEKKQQLVEDGVRAGLLAEIYRAFAGWKDLDASQRHNAVKLLSDLFNGAWINALEREAKKRERYEALRAAAITSTNADSSAKSRKKKRNEVKGKRKGILGFQPWEFVVSYLFGDNSEIANYLADGQRKADNDLTDAMQAVEEDFDTFVKQYIERDTVKAGKILTELDNPTIETDEGTYSELEAIDILLTWNQEDGRRHMEGHKDEETGKPNGDWHYGAEFVKLIEEGLSDTGKMILSFLQSRYSQEYERLNPLYRKLNGVDMPKNKFYAPIFVTPIQSNQNEQVDPNTGMRLSANATPGALRTRSGAIAEPDFQNGLEKYFAHKREMEHWLAYSEFSLEANAIFGNRKVRNAIEAKAGKEAINTIGEFTTMFTEGGTRAAGVHLGFNQLVSKMAGNFAMMALWGRLGTIAIQVTQLAAAKVEMSMRSYSSRMFKLFTGQLNWRAAIESDYIQRRLKEQPAVVRFAMDELAKGKPTRIKYLSQKVGQLIGGADALFTAGTFAVVYDYRLSKAKENGLEGSEAEAFALNEAERLTDRLAQPTRPGAKSIIENTLKSPIAKLAIPFFSESRKNISLMIQAQLQKGFWSKEMARATFYAVVANGLISALIRNAWRDLRDDEDDEIFDPKHWRTKQIVAAVATDWIYGVPALGEELQNGVLALLGETQPQGGPFSSIPRAVYAAKKLDEIEDIDDLLRKVEAIMTAFGLFNDQTAAATVFMHPIRDGVDIITNLIEN
ncbi:MAG: hypothetical protein VYC85_01125 [Pseudomonadota bacterium]|nr:hypothetical protein [Pseudomonadota bacterium]